MVSCRVTVAIRFASGRLEVTAPYQPRLLSALRSLPDRRWNPAQKVWLLPDTRNHGQVLLNALWETELFQNDPSGLTTDENADGSIQPLVLSEQWVSRCRERAVAMHYSPRTIRSYLHWLRRFLSFHGSHDPSTFTEQDINRYLTYLAVHGCVSASTQNQALAALLFLFRNVLGREVGDLGTVVRARRPVRLPVVLTVRETKALLDNLSGDVKLAATILYGGGLRLSECLTLRVQDIDFEKREVLIRDGKGGKDRVTMLPETVVPFLEQHLANVQDIHRQDVKDGWGRVQPPGATPCATPLPRT